MPTRRTDRGSRSFGHVSRRLSGLPALSVPCGFDRSGLPIGLQIAAGRFGEATLVRAGAAYQRETDWHLCEPAIVNQPERANVSQEGA